MRFVKKGTQTTYVCIGCNKEFGKYDVIQFREFDMCDTCFNAHPFSREKGILSDDESIIHYYKERRENGHSNKNKSRGPA